AHPALYLDELLDMLLDDRGIEISLATLSRAVRRLAISHKQISKEAQERNDLLRAAWDAKFGDIPMDYMVWVDESAVDDRTNQ
ncbi:hypothetical protein OF83DRAFT_1039735, partial [Amylostereum chailletii]